ncbi:MAG: protein kinase, partial [Enterobacter hormaechei]|nr:protein kinase [Enterobacter hormaechei]
LSRLREEKPELINEAWIRRMLPMLFGAIKTIHDEGYLHRDISLDNIQIQDNGLPVLLDFGSARRTIGNLSDETETMLRPGFAPIEQYTDDNESEQGPWTDIYALGAVLRTLIVGSPPPVSVVRSIQDTCKPLVELMPQGYSIPLLQAIDKALALHMEDRPQSIEEFAALIEMPVAGIDEVLTAKKTGTMLVPVEEEASASALDWRRYKLPGLVAAGVLVGVVAGAMLFGGDSQETPEQTAQTPAVNPPAETSAQAETRPATADVSEPVAPPATAQQSAPPVDASPVALVYIRMLDGETLKVNGESKALRPGNNGYASLKLPAGETRIELEGNGRTRTQTLDIAKPGTWLVNP